MDQYNDDRITPSEGDELYEATDQSRDFYEQMPDETGLDSDELTDADAMPADTAATPADVAHEDAFHETLESPETADQLDDDEDMDMGTVAAPDTADDSSTDVLGDKILERPDDI